MVHMVKLHLHARNEKDCTLILVNPENISYITPIEDGGSFIHFCCSASKEHQYQGIAVVESLMEIEALIKKA